MVEKVKKVIEVAEMSCGEELEGEFEWKGEERVRGYSSEGVGRLRQGCG